jgi:hypothetical protein
MENRAFDTSKLGVGYGFESHPKKMVEMPPTWALLVALAFMVAAMGFWVRCQYRGARECGIDMISMCRFTSPLICLHQLLARRIDPKSSTLQYCRTGRVVNLKHCHVGWTNGLQRRRSRRRKQRDSQAPRSLCLPRCPSKSQSFS